MIQINSVEEIQNFLKEKVRSIALEPEFDRHQTDLGVPCLLDNDGLPAVRVAIANASIDADIWHGLRSPAAVGLHPVGFREIWDFYAANNLKSVLPDGSPNYLAIPESFEEAKKRLDRAVIISMLLPIDKQVFEAYAEKITGGDPDNFDEYPRASSDVAGIISKVAARLSLARLRRDRVVVCMNSTGAKKVVEFSLADSQTGRYHGPCNDPFPQNSVAVLTGLMQFGVSRIPIRDERGEDGKVIRMMGHYATVVVFDNAPLVEDGSGGVVHLDAAHIEKTRKLSDYTVVDEDVVSGRFCPYNRMLGRSGKSVCGKCIMHCSSGAIPNSSPAPNGKYSESILEKKHRFHDGFLDFDFIKCTRERNQKQELYSEYACARCVAICAARGVSGLSKQS
ncbi:MAG: hypothetical protein E3J72_00210 [Planctomycetota bacterium]|nr:MAG: hypothetical protein E3J72_00210 [Planctomycetota bacterium]